MVTLYIGTAIIIAEVKRLLLNCDCMSLDICKIPKYCVHRKTKANTSVLYDPPPTFYFWKYKLSTNHPNWPNEYKTLKIRLWFSVFDWKWNNFFKRYCETKIPCTNTTKCFDICVFYFCVNIFIAPHSFYRDHNTTKTSPLTFLLRKQKTTDLIYITLYIGTFERR